MLCGRVRSLWFLEKKKGGSVCLWVLDWVSVRMSCHLWMEEVNWVLFVHKEGGRRAAGCGSEMEGYVG